jgi:GxxExxY protein
MPKSQYAFPPPPGGQRVRRALQRFASDRFGLRIPAMFHHEGTKTTKDTKASALGLSHKVIGAAIEVHRLLGPGLLESVYEVALCKELWLRRIRFERQVTMPVFYKGIPLESNVKLDLLVDRTIIVEVKSIERLVNVHRAQLLTYLRLRDLWLGLLINFNVEILRDGIRRVLNG